MIYQDDRRFPPKAGSVHPTEYDWAAQFSALDPADGLVLMDAGKVYGLARAYAKLQIDAIKLGVVLD